MIRVDRTIRAVTSCKHNHAPVVVALVEASPPDSTRRSQRRAVWSLPALMMRCGSTGLMLTDTTCR